MPGPGRSCRLSATTAAFSCGSELEAAVRSRQEALKELEAKEGMESPRRKAELCVEDLQEAPQAVSQAGRRCLT